jgi:thiosulfate/3-mercaptopyruvate sulfurtransferase
VLISGAAGDEYFASVHGAIGCVDCHGGTSAGTKPAAHEGLIRDPSEDPVAACGGTGCHEAIAQATQNSIHRRLTGYRTMIEARAGIPVEGDEALAAGFEVSCNRCHTTCGQCHVSRPYSVEGGFIASHRFNREPSMVNQCTACHGSRVGDEYQGKHKDLIPGYLYDVHFLKNSTLGGKHCVNCHPGQEMHSGAGEHRYAVAQMPRCEDCHDGSQQANEYHRTHWGELSCHVCHSQDYKHCDACHVPDGLRERSYLGFKIGKNPLPDVREYEYVTLRHIPIVRETYSGWGYTGGLPQFESLPTWKYTSPHNIRRWTARTDTTGGQGCSDACHDSPATTEGFFLRQVDLDRHPDDAGANAPYIVPDTNPTEWGD